MTLHIESRGTGAELVLLHGWGMHGGVWDGVQAGLAEHFRVHAVDLPGYGGSPACNPYALKHIVGLLAETFPGTVNVCGWSLGGQVAMQWALDRPAQVRQLVLVGATPRFVAAEDWQHGVEDDLFRQFAAQVTGDYRGTMQRFLSLQAQGGEFSREQIRQLRERFFRGIEPAQETLQAGLCMLLETDLRSAVPGLKQPVLLVHGTHDMLAPAAAAEWMGARLPDARLEMIAGASHAPFLSHQTEFMAMVRNFIPGLRA
jgi:pimeloyl-[acyl-carrier protein] methyl ester esterase